MEMILKLEVGKRDLDKFNKIKIKRIFHCLRKLNN